MIIFIFILVKVAYIMASFSFKEAKGGHAYIHFNNNI